MAVANFHRRLGQEGVKEHGFDRLDTFDSDDATKNFRPLPNLQPFTPIKPIKPIKGIKSIELDYLDHEEKYQEKAGMSDFPEMVYKATEPEEALPNIDAHGYLVGVYRGLIQPNGSRLKAAIAALPFERPKFAVVATTTSEDMVEKLERAMGASAKVINGRAMQVIEKPAQVASPSPVSEPLVSAEDMAKPMTRLDTRRFRRF
jgi:hypothetical protein